MKNPWLEPDLPITVGECCQIYKVSESGYYSWLLRQETPTEYKRRVPSEVLKAATNVFLRQFPGARPGYRKIRVYLRNQGYGVSDRRIRRLLRSWGIIGQQKRRHVVTTDSSGTTDPFPNVLNRDFAPGAINKRWVSDITYIRTREGWLYVITYTDLGSRRILSLVLADNMEANGVIMALNLAHKAAGCPTGVIAHSDQGSQYSSRAFREALSKNRMIGSMSGRGVCWDNAVAESLWSIMKRDLQSYGVFPTRAAARETVLRWAYYYNHTRPHSALVGLAPVQWEMNWDAPEDAKEYAKHTRRVKARKLATATWPLSKKA